MERRADRIAAIGVILTTVSARLGDVNLSTHRPWTVYRRLRHHPDGRPEPVSLRHLCDDFHTAIFERLLALGREASTTYWINNSTCGLVTTNGAHRVVVGAASSSCCQVHRVAINNLGGSDVCSLGGECWNNVKTFCIDVCIFRIVRRPIERAGSETTRLEFKAPGAVVNVVEVILEPEAEITGADVDVLVGANSSTNQDAEANCCPEDDFFPSLAFEVWILLADLPWFLIILARLQARTLELPPPWCI